MALKNDYTLMLVTDRKRARLALPELVRLSVEGGVNAIQVREKDLNDAELAALTAEIVEAASSLAWVVVNGNLEVAKTLGIGVHLPEDGPTVEQARAKLGESAIIGRSIHSVCGAGQSHGATYLVAGPFYQTESKPGARPMASDTFAAITKIAHCSVYAIGGIGPESIKLPMALGAQGVAVVGAICEADDPRAAATNLRTAIDHHARKSFD